MPRSRLVTLAIWTVAALSAVTSAGCGHTRVRLTTAPATDDAALLLDGRRVGYGKAKRRLPYFGTASVSTAPAPPDPAEAMPGPTVRGARQKVRMPAPVTPWAFPFDFPIEAILRLTGHASRELEYEIPVERYEMVDAGVPSASTIS